MYSPQSTGGLLISKPNTLRRAYAINKRVWSKNEFFTDHPVSEFSQQSTEGRSESNIINEMIGDTQGIQAYPELGYQIEKEIPEEVIEAFSNLVEMGFTPQMVKGNTQPEALQFLFVSIMQNSCIA